MECNFYFEVVAPEGLANVKEQIDSAGVGLYIYVSGFNNKGILKYEIGSVIELEMETSTTDVMFGSGDVASSFQEAEKLIVMLSDIFRSANFPHKIGLDDENGENTVWYTHKYS